MPKHFVLLTFTILFLASCSNSIEDAKTKTPELQKIMEGHQWNITTITSSIPVDFNGSGEKSTDIKSQNAPCQADDQFIFEKSNTLTLIDGAAKCPDREGKSNTGSWSTNDTYLMLKLPNTAPATFKVVSFQETEFKVSKVSPISRDAQTILTYTFTRTD